MNIMFGVSVSIFELNSKDIFEVVFVIDVDNVLLVVVSVVCEVIFYEESLFLVEIVASVFLSNIFIEEFSNERGDVEESEV